MNEHKIVESEAVEVTQKFNSKLMVERLPLPTKEVNYKVPLYSELHLLKNFESLDRVGIGLHKLGSWKQMIEELMGKEEFFTMYRIDTKPTRISAKITSQTFTYYEIFFGVNFKFKVTYNYSFRIFNSLDFLENISQYKEKYTFLELYKYIEYEINAHFLSFISKCILDKKISLLEFNSNTLEFSSLFTEYCNNELFNKSGIQVMDFNFVNISFIEDENFDTIRTVLFKKADMNLRNYTWKEQSKYRILMNQSSLKEEGL